MSSVPAPPLDSGGGAPRRREPGNFGPDAPPRGKKSKFKPAEPRGPKGPIRIKPNGRIYSTDDVEDEGADQFEGDNFATSAPREPDSPDSPDSQDDDNDA
jgi:hypothetical protein